MDKRTFRSSTVKKIPKRVVATVTPISAFTEVAEAGRRIFSYMFPAAGEVTSVLIDIGSIDNPPGSAVFSVSGLMHAQYVPLSVGLNAISMVLSVTAGDKMSIEVTNKCTDVYVSALYSVNKNSVVEEVTPQ